MGDAFGRSGRGPVFGGGMWASPPRDLLVLLAVLFVTFSLQFFAATGWLIGLLRLTPAVWRAGFVWQLATYAFVGFGNPDLWFLLALFIVYLFGRDAYYQLGRRRFWTLLLYGAVGGALVAVAVELLIGAFGPSPAPPFYLMQGQQVLAAILVAAFATLNRNATILLFFVLPMPARWFLWLEVLFAFLGYLSTRDLAGFLGITAAVAITYGALYPSGPRRALREGWLRLQQLWLRQRLTRLRRKRGLHVIPGSGERGPWRPN
jgi:hypothetical protein